MTNKHRINYEVEDFLSDESFTNYHFQVNTVDEQNWKQWIVAHPEKRKVINEARELLRSLSLSLPDNEYQLELDKITAAINLPAESSTVKMLNWSEQSKPKRKRHRHLGFSIPVLLAFIVTGYIFVHKSYGYYAVIETVNKQAGPLVVTLSDSTTVTLAPNSTLKYPLHFKTTNRNVYLTGEAQFHVKRNEKSPFKVFSENIVATVLGTMFTFKKSGDSTLVELINGKLNVELNNRAANKMLITLAPADKAIYVKHDEQLYKQPFTRPVNLYFHQNNFNEIALQIKNAFGITVINKSNKKLWRFTGDFKNTSTKEVIENICLVKGLSTEYKGDTIFIK